MDIVGVPEAVKQWEIALSVFLKDIAQEYDEARSNLLLSKKLNDDMRGGMDGCDAKLKKQEWTPEEAKNFIEKKWADNQESWTSLLEKNQKQESRIEAIWAKLKDAEKIVVDARGDGKFNSAWGSYATPEQKAVRKYHTKKLTPNLKEAKGKVDQMTGFPDGFCTRTRGFHIKLKPKVEKYIEQRNQSLEVHWA